MTTRLFFHWHF